MFLPEQWEPLFHNVVSDGIPRIISFNDWTPLIIRKTYSLGSAAPSLVTQVFPLLTFAGEP